MIRLRDLTPLGWLVTAAAGLLVLALILWAVTSLWSGLWDWAPWSQRARLERAEAENARLEADLANRRAETVLHERQAEAVTGATRVIVQARTVTERALTQAETAPDATLELDPVRVERLRDADRRLCELSGLDCAG